MLRELAVRNLGLIAEAKVELQPGFCAWTGETGAGKTMLLEALWLLLGRRGSAELIRTGEDQLRVSGCFELRSEPLRIAVARVLGQDPDEDLMILSRRLARSGKSHAYVNDHPVAVATLRELGKLLVDIHGQQESQSLLEPDIQLSFLDAYAGLIPDRDAFDALAKQIRTIQHTIRELEEDRQKRAREIALLEFEKEELDQANLTSHETAHLMKERERLAHAEKIQAYAETAAARLHDEEGAIVEIVGKLTREGEAWLSLDSRLADCQKRLEGIRLECTDLAQAFREVGFSTESQPARLQEVEERLRLLRRLETKHGKSIEDLIEYRTVMNAELHRLKNAETDLESYRADFARMHAKLKEIGLSLSKKRQKAVKKLVPAVMRELAELGMHDAKLDALFEPIKLHEDSLQSHIPVGGMEQMELMMAANRGEASLPLRRVASGGELSRAMLALKTVLAKHDMVPTLVFDEIDANVGGRLGDVLGEKLSALGKTHQVICVTHLPQVASYARHQWTIRKSTHGMRTITSIEALDEAQRLEELASMLRGKSRGESTKKEAAAMLATAKASW